MRLKYYVYLRRFILHMILIVSEPFDPTTDDVMRWLKKYNQKVIRINSLNELIRDGIIISPENGHISGSLNGYSLDQFKNVWFRRRPSFSNQNKLVKHKSISFDGIVSSINTTLVSEEVIVSNFLDELFDKNKIIGSMKTSSLNKLYQLKIASQLGITIPDTKVLTSRKDVLAFKDTHEKIIIKPLNNMVFMRHDNVSCYTYTKLVSDEIMKKIPEKFSPSLFQEYIDKEFEIRSFFLGREEYSMAIFSQKNDKTKIDFRKYDREYPNRRVPFKLPENLYKMVLSFMEAVNINTGSFDFIYSKSGKYTFLEVNPVGQFGMVSIPCNYYIEKRIAEKIISC